MDHTPTTPAADDRPIRILERTPVGDEHKQVLFGIVRAAQEAAADVGEQLQAEFGKEAVAMIVGCNQFVRLFRGGEEPGVVELLLPTEEKTKLAGTFTLREPEGTIFRMFGWVRVDPMQGAPDVLLDAVQAAFRKALASKRPAGAQGP